MNLREVFETAHSFNSYTEFESFIANKLDNVPVTAVNKHTYKVVSSSNVIPDVSNRYQITDIKLADWESVTIGDTKTNKVVCHFITENGFDEAVNIAKKITKFLNGC